MCWVYFLQFMDKQTLNASNAYSLQEDLHLHGRDYSWVASITNIGYLVCAYPVTVMLQKLPIGRFVSIMVIVWGVILAARKRTQSETWPAVIWDVLADGTLWTTGTRRLTNAADAYEL